MSDVMPGNPQGPYNDMQCYIPFVPSAEDLYCIEGHGLTFLDNLNEVNHKIRYAGKSVQMADLVVLYLVSEPAENGHMDHPKIYCHNNLLNLPVIHWCWDQRLPWTRIQAQCASA